MEYLQNLAQQCYIHKDLKSANILLDDDFRAKVSDFGPLKPAPDRKFSVPTGLAVACVRTGTIAAGEGPRGHSAHSGSCCTLSKQKTVRMVRIHRVPERREFEPKLKWVISGITFAK